MEEALEDIDRRMLEMKINARKMHENFEAKFVELQMLTNRMRVTKKADD